jgi:hypothetical protein
MVSLHDYVIPNPTVVGHSIDGEAVLILVEHGQVKVLNEVGARIWALVDGTRTARDIAAAISAEYAIDLSRAETDTLDFVAELAQRDIVSITQQP